MVKLLPNIFAFFEKYENVSFWIDGDQRNILGLTFNSSETVNVVFAKKNKKYEILVFSNTGTAIIHPTCRQFENCIENALKNYKKGKGILIVEGQKYEFKNKRELDAILLGMILLKHFKSGF